MDEAIVLPEHRLAVTTKIRCADHAARSRAAASVPPCHAGPGGLAELRGLEEVARIDDLYPDRVTQLAVGLNLIVIEELVRRAFIGKERV